MKGFTEVLPLVLCIAIAIAAVYTYGVAVGVNEGVVKKIIIEKDIYLLGNALTYSKAFLATSLKYSTYQALFDVADFNSTLPTTEEFEKQLSDKIKLNLNKYTEQSIVFLDDEHKIDLPKYRIDAVLKNNILGIQANGDDVKISQNTPTEKIDLAKDSKLNLELEYSLFEEARKFFSEKLLEKKMKESITDLPISAELKLIGCENKGKEISNFDVLNSVQKSNFASVDDVKNNVLTQLINEGNEFVTIQSTNKTKWEFFVFGNSTKLESSCRVEKEDKCDNNQTKSYTYTKSCSFVYSYQINASITLTDIQNKYPVESGLLLDKKANMENLKLKVNQNLDLTTNSII